MARTYDDSSFPVGLRVALGNVGGMSGVRVVGYNAAVPTSEDTIWTLNTVAPNWAATATIAKLSSADANDDSPDGTGALTVSITGLDLNGRILTETAALNGQTAVTLANTYWRINEFKVLTAGSGGVNAGILYLGSGTVTSGVPAVKNSAIGAGLNKALSAIYTVPGGYQAAITKLRWEASAAGQVRLYTREYGATVFTLQRETVVTATVWGAEIAFDVPIVVGARGDIVVRGLAAADTIKMSAEADVLLMVV